MCERDVGLFSLVQQVVANIPWALAEGRVPIALFQAATCYWTPNGHRESDTVWEYYFEPLLEDHSASTIPHDVRHTIVWNPPDPGDIGYFANETTFVTNHFGDHPELMDRALSIPYGDADPSDSMRRTTAALMHEYVRPRGYVRETVDRFRHDNWTGSSVIGVHARGTDALVSPWHPHRKGSLVLAEYAAVLSRLLEGQPDARIFVATDDQASFDWLAAEFGDAVMGYATLRRDGGEASGRGPTGGIMPAFLAGDREVLPEAARRPWWIFFCSPTVTTWCTTEPASLAASCSRSPISSTPTPRARASRPFGTGPPKIGLSKSG